ncbi:aminotransferase class IV [Paracoccus sp. (in: a-proteobacteria)]|uniref:aminotransferase class IV n=1 Tax=Paracoccus sp. TaxID=267 RepID=UPI003A84538F
MQIRLSAPAGLTVFETMRAEAGCVLRWPLHRERLRRDCAAVGFQPDMAQVDRALTGLPRAQILRVRLTVDAGGQVAVTHQPLPPGSPEWCVVIAGQRLDSADPWLRIKTSHRPAHDAARAHLPAEADEAILLNERGEICEGSITNLFARRGDMLLTPPLDCGLLPGVLRQELLQSGRAREAVLRPADLADGALFMGNSLRGLIPARVQAGRKVLIYATSARGLLVFDEPDFPDVPLQVPGGTVEPDETPAIAAARELLEETGIAAPTLCHLADRWFTDRHARLWCRSYFHAILPADLPESWLHAEAHASNGAVPIRFRLHWLSVPEARQRLGMGQGECLDLLPRR